MAGSSGRLTKSEQTRERILSSYVGLLGEVDFDKVTVSRLCKESGIVRSTFYVYFSDIFEVIQAVEDDLIAEFAKVDAIARTHAEEDERRVTTEWGFPIPPAFGLGYCFDVFDQNRTRLQAMLGPHGDPYFEQKLRRHLIDHVNLLMDEDSMPDDDLRNGFLEAMVEAHMILARNWLFHEGTTLTKARICTIVNAMRFGAASLAHYGQKSGISSWWD